MASKKNNIDPNQLSLQTINKREHICFTKQEKGKPTNIILATFIPNLTQLPLPSYTSNANHTFIRPVHWIVSLLDKTVVPFKCFNIDADRISYGHRTLSNSKSYLGTSISISTATTYETQLEKRALFG